MQFALKIFVSAVIIASVSEIAKRSSVLAALTASLPLTSILAITWLYVDTRDTRAVAELSIGIFWMVIPSLLFFVAMWQLLQKNVSYWFSLGIAIVITAAGYAVFEKTLALIKR